MGRGVGLTFFCGFAEIPVSGTDHLHKVMKTRTQQATERRQKERVMRWNNIVHNLASRNAGRFVLMDLEHNFRALDQSRFTTDVIHFDTIEGQA